MMANRNAFIVIAALFLLALGLPLGGVVPQAAAQVTVTGANPSAAAADTLGLSVTITGTGFKSGATAKFYRVDTTDTGGVKVISTTYKRSTTLVAKIDVPATAAIGSYDIVVTSGTSATGRARFTVMAKRLDPCAQGSPVLTTLGYRDATFAAPAGMIATPKFVTITGVALDAQQRIVAVGSRYDSCSGTGTREWVVMRFLPDGAPDLTFGGTGMVTKSFTRYHADLHAVAIDASDGSIVVGGEMSGKSIGLVARYDDAGELDTTFAADGIEPGVRSLSLERYMTLADAIAIQSDRKIVVAGWDGGNMAVFRLNADGSFDTTGFNANAVYKPQLPGRYVHLTPGRGTSVAIQKIGDEERIVVAGVTGVMKNGVGVKDAAVWRFTSAGELDPTFGTDGLVTTDFYGGYESFNAVAIDSSNRIVAAGYADKGPDYTYGSAAVLARYGEDGALDGSFNGGAPSRSFVAIPPLDSWTQSLSALAIDPAGGIYAAGSSYQKDAGGATIASWSALWRLQPDGTLDSGFGSAGRIFDTLADDASYGGWKALTLQADGKAVVAGSFTWGAVYPAIARYWQ